MPQNEWRQPKGLHHKIRLVGRYLRDGRAHLRDEHEILYQSHQRLETIARQVDELKLSLKEGQAATDRIDVIAQSLHRLEQIFASTKPATPGNVVKK